MSDRIALSAKIALCARCKAPVRFLRHRSTGRQNIVDAHPAPNGNLGVDLERGECYSVKAAERAGRADLHLSHFATCPFAKDFRP